jgi:dissimilatory sulfite reductase (desulfoviridin) alpha/beta subunit
LSTTVPPRLTAVNLFLGGGNYIGGGRYGTRVTRIPAKRMPQAVAKIIRTYQEERREGERFLDCIDRLGPKHFDPVLAKFREVGPIHEEIDVYMDWGREELFEVIRGEAECAM